MSRTVACDTSVIVPALTSWHPRHVRARELITTEVTAVPAHVLLECYSVLTRLPGVHRVAADQAAAAIGHLRLPVIALPSASLSALVLELARAQVWGGATYDGLIGATARHHDALLYSADTRARGTYDALGVAVALL